MGSRQQLQIPAIHRGLISFGCILLGWAAMILYLFARYYQYSDDSPQWYSMPAAIAVVSLGYVGAVWALLVLPLFLLLRPSRRFWSPFFCVPTFAVAGFLIMAVYTRFNYAHPFGLIWLLATICGGATGLVSAIAQRQLAARIKQAEQGAADRPSSAALSEGS